MKWQHLCYMYSPSRLFSRPSAWYKYIKANSTSGYENKHKVFWPFIKVWTADHSVGSMKGIFFNSGCGEALRVRRSSVSSVSGCCIRRPRVLNLGSAGHPTGEPFLLKKKNILWHNPFKQGRLNLPGWTEHFFALHLSRVEQFTKLSSSCLQIVRQIIQIYTVETSED